MAPRIPARARTGTEVPFVRSAFRRAAPWLVVPVPVDEPVDGADVPSTLLWALREAARREATVLVVALVDAAMSEHARTATRSGLESVLGHAVAVTGVHGRARVALMDEVVFEALVDTTRGGDLVVVPGDGVKTLLRPVSPRRSAPRPVVCLA